MSLPLPVGLTVGFDAPILLFWLTAAGIPLLLAALARRRLQQLAFGGFQLLRQAARSTAARAVPVGWLVPALRMAMLAAAVLAAASPYLVAGRAGPNSSGEHGNGTSVWLVTGKRSAEMSTDNDTTEKAIVAALAATGGGLKPLTTVTATSVSEAMRASQSGDVLIMCDGLVLSPQETVAWWRWVEDGGVAVVLLGPETLRSPDWPLWQASLADRMGLAVSGAAETGGSPLLVKPEVLGDCPVGRPAADGFVSLSGPTINRLVGLTLLELPQGLEAFAVTGKESSPVAVCRTVGRGALTISALPLSLRAMNPVDSIAGRWSDLTAWPVFLPYLRGLIRQTVVCCRPLRSQLSGWWSVRLLPGILLVTSLLALAGETMLSRMESAGGREGSGWGETQLARWRSGLGRAVAVVALVTLAWQMLRRPNAVEHDQVPAAPVAGAVAALDPVEAELPPLCWPGEEVEIPVTCIGPRTSPTRLILDGPGGRLAEALLPPTGDTTAAAIAGVTTRLLWKVDEDMPPGSCRLQLRFLPAAGENAERPSFSSRLLEATTTIADRPASLLMVDVEPRFEYRFARQAVAGDPRLTITTKLLAADQPIAASDWAKHDVIWLGDCLGLSPGMEGESPPGLSAAVCTSLGQQLAAGRLAVAWQPGERFRRTGFAVGQTAGWLPVEAYGPLSQPLRAGGGLPLLPLPAGIDSGWLPADRLPLPGVYGLLKPVGLRPTTVSLAATVATDQEAAAPAIVLSRHGRGNVLGHLCETWRWRAEGLPGGTNLHEAYWRQTLCRLATGPLLQRLSVGAEAMVWPQRFARQLSAAGQQSAEPGQTESGRPRHWLIHLLLTMLVAACLVAWWPQPWSNRVEGA